ncbi:DNA-protecting protein DprA [Rossellomorea marisflavi]|uniref:DNA-protecting protein DprA n=1 Tax=Rossellomorea marisflavi TaxID=189381 RepID=UPI0034579F61
MFNFSTIEELKEFLANEILFTQEATKYLGISPQRLNKLVHSGKISSIKSTKSNSIFLKSDLYERKFEIEKNYGASRSSISDSTTNTSEITNDAINYFTLLALFKSKYKKCDPIYNHMSTQISLTKPTSEIVKEFSNLTGFDEREILLESHKVRLGIESLNKDDYIVKIGSEIYPKLLENTPHAPMFLFMRGNPNLLNFNIISIVGTRNPSEYSVIRAKKLAEKFGQNRIVVASGLAKGIDAAAHTGALNMKNPTISVIGTPLTKSYPKENKDLQDQIEKEGLIISQFAPSMAVQRWNFPMRNAVMSGISLATVIIEAGETSGSLIQADYALKQGRIVFIPQSAIDNEELKWPKKYTLRKGANTFKTIEELLNILANSHQELLPTIIENNEAPLNISEGRIGHVRKND